MPHSIQKKILIVVESIDVEDSSGSKANVALIRNLNELGYELQVIHYTRKEVILDGILCVAIKEQRLSFLFYLSRLERYIRYFLKIELNKFLENLFGFSFTLLNDRNSIVREIKSSIEWNPDLILTLSKGGSFRPHHALLKVPSMHNKWMAYIHDPYPMHWYPNPYPWFEPGFKQKERFIKNVANKAKLLAFPSKILLEWMGAHFSPFKTKGIVIPHQIVRKEKIIESLPLYFNEKNFNLVHAGNLINGRNPKGLVLGFKKFLEDNVEARLESRLIFLGGENFYSKMLAQYANNNPQLLLSPKKLSFDLVQNLQQKSSVNIILEARSEISPFLPGKFPHCVQANKLILHIGPLNSEVKRLLGKEYPYHSEIDNVEEISSLIEKLYFRWKEDVLNMELNRPDIVKYLSKDHLIDQMKLSFNRLEGYHLS
jgi:hypothetical protein